MIAAIARREQQARGAAPQAHGKKTHRNLKEQQESFVSSIPGVGNAVAKNLLAAQMAAGVCAYLRSHRSFD